ncbi:hypothetical protein LTR08_006936 [Meristemomyces frigidus]|nr:hypothetical protein LTR08_006936 [Meristemomyces frigidus]
MRLLEYDSAGKVWLTKDFVGNDVPPYAILSHTWGAEGTEVTFADLTHDTGKGKPGYDKIRFCGDQARRDTLTYFWVDTCCIDNSNNTELSEAINSMFRWYQNAVKCYVYLSDVSQSPVDSIDGGNQELCGEFRKSRWFTRGWTLQELLAPASVVFFTKEGQRLGDKKSLEGDTSEVTGIPIAALRGRPLSSFSIIERRSWQTRRETTRKEDKAYSLLGICGVYMPIIYGEGEEHALKRLQDTTDGALKDKFDLTMTGTKRDDFSVPFSLADVPEIQHFVARKDELGEVQQALSGDGGRRTVVLYGLGGIGKTQLAVEYTKRHRDDYSALFWLNIKDADAVKQSFAKIASQILRSHPSADRISTVDVRGNLDDTVDAVKAWLSLPHNTRWLMVYDNYDNPRVPGNQDTAAVDIRKFLPETYQGSIIITTRSSQVKIGRCMQVRKLQSLPDSLEILSSTSGRQMSIHSKDEGN